MTTKLSASHFRKGRRRGTEPPWRSYWSCSVSVRLKCVASGHPRPDIMWMKDDQALTRPEAGEHRKKKWTLSLKNLRPEDSGKYTCRVSNRAGAINATYKVEPEARPPAASGSPSCGAREFMSPCTW